LSYSENLFNNPPGEGIPIDLQWQISNEAFFSLSDKWLSDNQSHISEKKFTSHGKLSHRIALLMYLNLILIYNIALF